MITEVVFDHLPDPVIDLGDGTYYENSNIEEFYDELSESTRWRADVQRKNWPVAPPVPLEVYAWRLRIVVKNAGLKEAVDNLIDQLPSEQKAVALEAWNYGVTIRRDSPLISHIADALELTEEEVDGYFIAANAIEI